MDYILAIFMPPLAVLIAGRVWAAIFIFLLWVIGWLFLPVFSHVLFVVLAWIIIAQAHADDRHREIVESMKGADD